jgi:CRP-like cAMP-binding protein
MPKLNIVEKVIALEGIELFGKLAPDQLARIAAIAHEVNFAPGAVILDASKPIDGLYVITEGAVELSHESKLLTTARQDEVLGSWALFEENDPIQLNASAIDDTRLLYIARDDFFELLADHSEITSAIFATLVKRFREVAKR